MIRRIDWARVTQNSPGVEIRRVSRVGVLKGRSEGQQILGSMWGGLVDLSG